MLCNSKKTIPLYGIQSCGKQSISETRNDVESFMAASLFVLENLKSRKIIVFVNFVGSDDWVMSSKWVLIILGVASHLGGHVIFLLGSF